MSIALQRENGDLIWFDAVLSYSRSYSSSISKHPIESGGVVTDNVTQENPQFNISGIITNADFNKTRPEIDAASAKAFGISNRRIYNSQPIPDGSKPIIGAGQSPIAKFLPQTITQFMEGQPPSVEVPDSQRPDWVYEVEDILVAVERNHELVSILEFKDNLVSRVYEECYVSNVTFNETPETGDAFEVTMTIEKPKFVTLRSEVISSDVIASLSSTTATQENRGSQTAPSAGETDNAESKDEPTNNRNKDGATWTAFQPGDDLVDPTSPPSK